MMTRAATIVAAEQQAPSATPLPCRVPLNGMFHQDSATQ